MADRDNILDCVELLASSIPSAGRLREDNIRAYVAVLKPLSDELLQQAVLVLARQDREFMPSAGKVYQTAVGLADDNPSPAEAWGMVLRATANGKPDGLPARALAALEAAGGFEALRRADSSENVAHRARFLEAYREATTEHAKLAALLPGGHLRLTGKSD